MYVDTEVASTIASNDHLSPPSTTSRLSESDMSDLDLEDGSLPRERRTDGASISSVGSSSRRKLRYFMVTHDLDLCRKRSSVCLMTTFDQWN
ncbi:hypothetical protein SK128_020584 [Halocaridina rubra]|uniref:Uncharacterized protein n=1 Tax=Halocaridina rubra TaxID=373956 RepID=A0AAN8WFS4_HALRR